MCQDCCIPFDYESACVSPYGVQNMNGNAMEWVLDWMDDDDDHSWCAMGCTDPEPTTGARPNWQ